MPRRLIPLIPTLLFFAGVAVCQDFAPLPPMGWNSWNLFRTQVTASDIREVADAMVSSGMKQAGYVYVNIDDGWQGERDANGVLHGNAAFPDMKALGDYLHARGLKFGLYSSPGARTCANHEGSLGHEEQDAQTFAAWGVDYLKYDLCSYGNWVAHQAQGDPDRASQLAAEAYARMDKALRETGRPVVFSISQHGLNNVAEWAPRAGAQLWRTTEDIQDRYERMAAIGFSQDGLAAYAGPNHWNDPDMLVIGNGNMSEDECRTQMSLWAILAAPLLASNDVRHVLPGIASILLASEVIAIDQDPMGKEGHRIMARGLVEVWERPMSDGSMVVGVFNRDTPYRDLATVSFSLPLSLVGIPSPVRIRDIWGRKDVPATNGELATIIAGHGAALYRIYPRKP
ncbi:MAG: glycoside hydrolase family 27 protein [Edaphobacter sp.]